MGIGGKSDFSNELFPLFAFTSVAQQLAYLQNSFERYSSKKWPLEAYMCRV